MVVRALRESDHKVAMLTGKWKISTEMFSQILFFLWKYIILHAHFSIPPCLLSFFTSFLLAFLLAFLPSFLSSFLFSFLFPSFFDLTPSSASFFSSFHLCFTLFYLYFSLLSSHFSIFVLLLLSSFYIFHFPFYQVMLSWLPYTWQNKLAYVTRTDRH